MEIEMKKIRWGLLGAGILPAQGRDIFPGSRLLLTKDRENTGSYIIKI